ncbi:MAG: hypothetical protein IT284_00750 [Bacteroidetes bacterium]|nr:hypothetical protein [Bacteroidota bacterium]
MKSHKHYILLFLVAIIIAGVYFYFPSKQYSKNVEAGEEFLLGSVIKLPEIDILASHIKTPEKVRAIYMTSWGAGTSTIKNRVISVADETEINAIIVDIKDDTGKVSYLLNAEPFLSLESTENRIPDIKDFIANLHAKNIYVIGRIATFQDPYLIKKWPEEAVKTETDKEKLWRDRKGLGWMDAGSQKVWDYVVSLAEESYNVGFDEINFDYVRFPSDGNMKDIYFPLSNGKIKRDVLESFFMYLDQKLRKRENPIPISVDLFGMTTTNTDDLGIGQVLEKALPYFDYVAPMVYPSHYPDTWNGFANPAEHPYDVVKIAMGKAVERAIALGEDPKKLRPWIQDFNLGAIYTEELVRAQIQAAYDVGLDSWLVWDPKNIYTRKAFLTE